MIDIECFVNSLKASWVKRLKLSDSLTSRIYSKQLNTYGGHILFKCNTSVQNLKHIKFNSQFLSEIVYAWIVGKHNDNIATSKQILWNHSEICRSNGNAFFYKNWFSKGIQYIEHIYDFRTKRFYYFEDFSMLYNIPRSDFLKYHILVTSVTPEIKANIEKEEMCYKVPTYIFDNIKENTKVCKYMYETFIKQKVPNEIKSQTKWATQLTYENINWKEIYLLPIKLTIDTKLREFQFKFLHQIIPTNTFLFKCNIVSSSLCEFCNSNPDSIAHMFWECQHIQIFWTSFTDTFLKKLNVENNINFNCIVFCNLLEQNQDNYLLVNYLILLAKYFIFKEKCQNHIPVISGFKSYVKDKQLVEDVIASMKQKQNDFNKKWQLYQQLF